MRIYSRKLKTATFWYIDYTNQRGQRIRKPAGPGMEGKNRARAMLADIQVKLYQHRYADIDAGLGRTDLLTFVDRYFNYCSSVQRPETVKQDRVRLKKFISYCQGKKIRTLMEITPALVEGFQSEYMAGHSRRSWNLLLSVVKTMLNKAVLWNMIQFNPIAKLKPLKLDRRFNYFSQADLKAILDAASEPMRTVILLLAHTGMRRSELFHLRWRDVDLEMKRITIRPSEEFTTKNRRPRVIPLSRTLDNHLRELRGKPSDLVCRPYEDIQTYRKNFKKILKAIELKGTLHDLRHTFASHLAMAGVPIPAIAELLGHQDIKTTMIYAHLAPEIHRAAIDKLPF